MEATNVPVSPQSFKLAYRSKGTLVHSAGFRIRASFNTAFDAHIDAAVVLYGVSRDLVRAIIQVESAFDNLAVSTAGARGLMQLMPATASRFGVNAARALDGARMYRDRAEVAARRAMGLPVDLR
jgi:membrane-bound lytic murein transglycosylase B